MVAKDTHTHIQPSSKFMCAHYLEALQRQELLQMGTQSPVNMFPLAQHAAHYIQGEFKCVRVYITKTYTCLKHIMQAVNAARRHAKSSVEYVADNVWMTELTLDIQKQLLPAVEV